MIAYWVFVAVVAAYVLVRVLHARRQPALGRSRMAAWLDDFIDGRRGVADWPEFERMPGDSTSMDWFKDSVLAVPRDFPPETVGALCSPAGIARLGELRAELSAPPPNDR